MSSKIQVDSIQGVDAESSPNFPLGVSVPSGYAVDCSGGMVVNGTLTATSFVGDGSNLTGIDFATLSKTVAFSILAG